jgi:hypothetical protein
MIVLYWILSVLTLIYGLGLVLCAYRCRQGLPVFDATIDWAISIIVVPTMISDVCRNLIYIGWVRLLSGKMPEDPWRFWDEWLYR